MIWRFMVPGTLVGHFWLGGNVIMVDVLCSEALFCMSG